MASSVSQSQGAYVKQQLRSVTRRYLDHFLPASPSLGIIANHPVLLGACETNPTIRGAALRRTILEVLWWVDIVMNVQMQVTLTSGFIVGHLVSF